MVPAIGSKCRVDIFYMEVQSATLEMDLCLFNGYVNVHASLTSNKYGSIPPGPELRDGAAAFHV